MLPVGVEVDPLVIERRDINIGGLVSLLRLLVVLIVTVVLLLAIEVVHQCDLLVFGAVIFLGELQLLVSVGGLGWLALVALHARTVLLLRQVLLLVVTFHCQILNLL